MKWKLRNHISAVLIGIIERPKDALLILFVLFVCIFTIAVSGSFFLHVFAWQTIEVQVVDKYQKNHLNPCTYWVGNRVRNCEPEEVDLNIIDAGDEIFTTTVDIYNRMKQGEKYKVKANGFAWFGQRNISKLYKSTITPPTKIPHPYSIPPNSH